MSPRRPRRNFDLIPRRARRSAADTGGSIGEDRLSISSPAPGQFQNGVAGSGVSLQLVTGAGQPIALAGVVVSVRTPLGSGATVSGTPSQAVTDSSGLATFTALTLTGTAGTYSLEFTAPGYTGVTSTGHQLVAGPAVAAQSTADVPNGRVGQLTIVDIQLRDQNGNPLTVAGTSPVTVQVSGSNTVSQTTIGFGVNLQKYRFTYTPQVAGTDTVTIRYGGTQISGSPYTSGVSAATGGFTANSLRVGLNNTAMTSLLGTGPKVSGGNWSTQEPIFRICQGDLTPSQLETAIDLADEKDILLVIHMPGTTNDYTDATGGCNRYNDTKFKNGVNAFFGRAGGKIESALTRRRVMWQMFDEPWHTKYCGTMTPLVLRNAFRYVKTLHANQIIASRMEPQWLRAGWSGQTNLPVNYFDKLDYCWATYRGALRTPSKGETPRQYFERALTVCNDAGYGMVCAHNWVNLGDDYCWKAYGPGDNRDGRIHGDSSRTGQSAQITPCSDPIGEENLWAEDPARIIEVCQAAASIPSVPFITCYQHPGESNIVNTAFRTLMKRQDYIDGWVAGIQAGENRSTTFTWRTPK